MKKILYLFSLIALSTTLLFSDPIDLTIKGNIVELTTNNGKTEEILKPLGKNVTPKQIIEYTITAKNNKENIIKNVKLNGKIPKGTSYIDGSATNEAMFSIDNGKTFKKEPVTYTILENGKKVTKTATPDMFTNIKWNVSKIEPKQSQSVKYRVQVK